MALRFWSSRVFFSPPSVAHLYIKPTAPFWIDERQNFGDFRSSRSSSLQSGVAVIGWSIYDFDTTAAAHRVNPPVPPCPSLSFPPSLQHHHLIHLIPQYWLNLSRQNWACCRWHRQTLNSSGSYCHTSENGDFPLLPTWSFMCPVLEAKGSFSLLLCTHFVLVNKKNKGPLWKIEWYLTVRKQIANKVCVNSCLTVSRFMNSNMHSNCFSSNWIVAASTSTSLGW